MWGDRRPRRGSFSSGEGDKNKCFFSIGSEKSDEDDQDDQKGTGSLSFLSLSRRTLEFDFAGSRGHGRARHDAFSDFHGSRAGHAAMGGANKSVASSCKTTWTHNKPLPPGDTNSQVRSAMGYDKDEGGDGLEQCHFG